MKLTREFLKKYLSPRELVLLYRRWDEDEITYLEENHGVLNVKQIAEHLHLSKGDIRYMARVLQLESVKPPWTAEQVELLTNHKDWPLTELATELGKSENAVKQKLGRLQLS